MATMRSGSQNGQRSDPEAVMSGTADITSERSGFTEMQVKGEVDVQIATAKRFPRNMKLFLVKAESMATIDEETAESCFYSLPARRGGNEKPIEGPSVRFAEIVAASWGNLRVQAQIVEDDGKFITAQGRCWDLENNVAAAVDVRRKITTKDGKRFSDDMINTTANAACSIAFRNAVMKIVPMAMARSIYIKARQVAIGDASTLVAKRGSMIEYFRKMNISAEQVCAAVSKASIEDITVEDLATLKGMATAIKDGETTVDEAFPRIDVKKNQNTEKPPTTPGPAGETQKETIAKTKQSTDPLSGLREALLKCTTQAEVEQLDAEWRQRPLSDGEFEILMDECDKRIKSL